jgi:hypothetical protein
MSAKQFAFHHPIISPQLSSPPHPSFEEDTSSFYSSAPQARGVATIVAIGHPNPPQIMSR